MQVAEAVAVASVGMISRLQDCSMAWHYPTSGRTVLVHLGAMRCH